jgi:hypothetical protein
MAPVERTGPPASPIGSVLVIFFILFLVLCVWLALFT